MSTVEPTVVLVPNHQMVLQLSTDRQVHAFNLAETFRIGVGRHHSNDLQLRSRRVSNYHAEIVSEVEGVFVRDMGSTNGT
ncbi:MAG: FHA domain-containing protein, partial [Vicinamibacteria bacterium]